MWIHYFNLEENNSVLFLLVQWNLMVNGPNMSQISHEPDPALKNQMCCQSWHVSLWPARTSFKSGSISLSCMTSGQSVYVRPASSVVIWHYPLTNIWKWTQHTGINLQTTKIRYSQTYADNQQKKLWTGKDLQRHLQHKIGQHSDHHVKSSNLIN